MRDMAPYGHTSQFRQNDPNEACHRPENAQYKSSSDQASYQSTYRSNVERDVAYSQGAPVPYHPQQQQSDHPGASGNQYTPSKPHAPPMRSAYNPQHPHPQESHSAHTTAMYAEKKRLTQSRLEVLDNLAQFKSAMETWEEETPQAGPWNGVEKFVYEKRRK
ncbi:hypothetical protein ST47_g7093 [Ascochyta rabiei]|uniref:Uncharacterized protein n=1 Tax=Didymella rabiei TaxID=5454 RepID=A0A163BF45_DIDRA|nr:hypothetical protein ST47_g7093 [Ascochyta rabiei]